MPGKKSALFGIGVFASLFYLAGCGGSAPITVATGSGQGAMLHGTVHGGQQPVSGASVYLYAANTTGYGSASISLLEGGGYVTTAADGTFAITNDYSCPSSTSQVYVYAVGGSAGSGANSAIGMLAGLGECGTLLSEGVSYPTIVVNEVSTIATAYAIAGFATDATHVSSANTTLGMTGIANAFATIPNLENMTTGLPATTTQGGNGTVPQAEINTLANILAGCVNSTSSSSTGCSTLLGAATNASGTVPTDTATAAINIAQNPGANVMTLYNLSTADAPFQTPAPLNSQPNDFTVAITFTGGSLSSPLGVAIDASGEPWVVNAGQTGAGNLEKFSPTGVVMSPAGGYTGGGLQNSTGLAIDGSGDVWVTSVSGNDVAEFSSMGAVKSPGSGYSVMGMNGPWGIAIDASNNVWTSNFYDDMNGNGTINEINSSGDAINGSPFTTVGLDSPFYLAVDASGNVWAPNDDTPSAISEFSSTGIQNTNSPFTGGGLNFPTSVAVDASGNIWTTDNGGGNGTTISELSSNGTANLYSPFSGGGTNDPSFLAIDGAGNVWVLDLNSNTGFVSEFNSSGSPITGSSGYLAGLKVPDALAIDGSGNVWVTDAGGGSGGIGSLVEFVGAAVPVVTPMVANLQAPYGGSAVNASAYNSLALPAPNPATLSSGAVGQPYTGLIAATGGTGPFVWTVNGTAVPTNNNQVSIGDGLSVYNNGGNTLWVTGTPAAITSLSSPISFTAQIEDTSTTNVAGPDLYTIAVNATGGQISGQVNLNSACGSPTLPAFTVTLTNTANGHRIQQISSNGQFTFTGIPAATYNMTASAPGSASSVFSPASYSGIAVTSSTLITGENFGAMVGYNVSGKVNYSGTQTGQTYLYLVNSCDQLGPGTSISEATLTSGGDFTINGVQPGSYSLSALMDSTGITSGTGYPGAQGQLNVNDPLSTSSPAVTVTNANVTASTVTLASPTYAVPNANPSFAVIPSTNGFLLFYTPPTVSSANGNKEEDADEYTVQWAVANSGTDGDGNAYCALGGGNGGQFGSVAGSHTFYAVGTNTTVWILDSSSTGYTFNAGTGYCFQARAFNTLYTAGTDHPSGWYDYNTDGLGNPQPVTVPTSLCSSGCTTIQGTITTGAAPAVGAPLYVGLYQQAPNSNGPSAIYAYEISSPANGANNYSITIPNGSNYYLFGILDQNNDGQVDVGDNTNLNSKSGSMNSITASGGTMTGVNLSLPTGNSTAVVQTQYQTCTSGCTYNYQLVMEVNAANKLPVNVELTVGPNVIYPVDMSQGACCGTGGPEFYYVANILGPPNVGDTFGYTVTYSDGSQDTGTTVSAAVTAFGTTGAVVGASDAPSNLETSGSNPDEPNFGWTDSANAMGSNYYYFFSLNQTTTPCPSNNCTIWQIPGENSNTNGFSSSITSLTWGMDPTGGGSTPAGSLSGSDQYNWTIQVQDTNGNQAQTTVNYTP